MADEMEGEDMELFARFSRRASSTLQGRRERETRPIARSDRVISRGSIKTAQLNLKVTPEFYERVAALSRNGRLSMPAFVERTVEFYELAAALSRKSGLLMPALIERVIEDARPRELAE